MKKREEGIEVKERTMTYQEEREENAKIIGKEMETE